jgi:threonine dehydrogenase-like Zn-dependent dehydrogenase
MRALVVEPPKPGGRIADVPEPTLGEGGIRVRVLECGVCGTDRDIVQGLYGTPPAGQKWLVLGHENFGRVLEVAPGVSGFRPGDYVVATVRRGCGRCHMCQNNASDLCETGAFQERGIRGQDGYMAEQYVETPPYLVKVPPRLRDVAVLLEPLSVVEKAVRLGERQLAVWERPGRVGPHAGPYKSLVVGTGAVGLLAALVLKVRGFEVVAVDRHSGTPAERILGRAGVSHLNVSAGLSTVAPEAPFHLIVEAAGSARVDLDLFRYLGNNGILVLTGIPAAGDAFPVPAGSILRQAVLENQVMAGSVNANRDYFVQGLRHLREFYRRWGDLPRQLITSRAPLEEFSQVLEAKGPETIKSVLTLGA